MQKTARTRRHHQTVPACQVDVTLPVMPHRHTSIDKPCAETKTEGGEQGWALPIDPCTQMDSDGNAVSDEKMQEWHENVYTLIGSSSGHEYLNADSTE